MTEAAELSALPFGRKVCEADASMWVQFKTSGYPRKLRREWDAANTSETVWAIVARYVADWHITDLAGQPVPVASVADLRALDNVEDAVVTWIIRAFSTFWLTEATVPRPNLSRPLATTLTA